MWPVVKLFFGGALGFLKGLPWQVWVGLATLAAALVGWHVIKVKEREAYRSGYAQAKADDKAAIEKVTAKAIILRGKVESLGSHAAEVLKEQHDAKISSVGRDVADIMRSGPGKARCGSANAPFSLPAARRQEPAGGPGTPAVGEVPDSGGTALIAVPFDDFVHATGQCDINRDEVLKWRSNDDQQRSIWESYRKTLAAPPK